MRVLLVEDDRDQLRLLQMLVENAGHVAVTCATMAAARAAAPCDLALIDRHLPDGDGIVLARELDAEVYILTGDESDMGAPNLGEPNVSEPDVGERGPRVLVKPVHMRDLLRILEEHGNNP